MKVQRYLTGLLDTNCYILTDEATGKAAILDPGGVTDELDQAVRGIGYENIEYILLTHGHFDHIGGVDYFKRLTKASVVLQEADAAFTQNADLSLGSLYMTSRLPPFQAERLVKDGDCLQLGKTRLQILHTPGHTPGGCCYVTKDVIFSGDTLMRLGIGRTDFPMGSHAQMKESLLKLSALSGDYLIYPGHGDYTTLQYERENNPYLGMVTYDDFN